MITLKLILDPDKSSMFTLLDDSIEELLFTQLA